MVIDLLGGIIIGTAAAALAAIPSAATVLATYLIVLVGG